MTSYCWLLRRIGLEERRSSSGVPHGRQWTPGAASVPALPASAVDLILGY